MPDGTTCANPINQGKYIMDFTCGNPYSTNRMLKEARLSFPSGHSSFTFYTMVYLAVSVKSCLFIKLFSTKIHFYFSYIYNLAWLGMVRNYWDISCNLVSSWLPGIQPWHVCPIINIIGPMCWPVQPLVP